jgi:hypothetical protein
VPPPEIESPFRESRERPGRERVCLVTINIMVVDVGIRENKLVVKNIVK